MLRYPFTPTSKCLLNLGILSGLTHLQLWGKGCQP